MIKRGKCSVLTILILLFYFGTTNAQVAEGLYAGFKKGSTNESELHRFDTTGGVLSIVDSIALTASSNSIKGVFGLAQHPQTKTVYILYQGPSANSSSRTLGTVDLSSGVISDIGNCGNLTDLEFSANGVLYGLSGANDVSNAYSIHTVDITSASTTLYFKPNPQRWGGSIAYDENADSLLYVRNGGMVSRVGLTVAAEKTISTTGLTNDTQAAQFLDANTVIVNSINNLYSLNLLTKTFTLLSNNSDTYHCFEFLSFGPSISFNNTNISTNGGSDGVARAIVTGGTAPYSYLWSTGATTDSITGLAAGTYMVTVTDSDPNGAQTVVDSAVFFDPPFVAEYPDSFEYQMGTNPAGLDTARIPTTQQRFVSPVLGDLDGDGDKDFITGSNEGRFFYYENTGTINNPFWVRTPHPTLDTIDFPSPGIIGEARPSLVDIDADGDLDLFIGSRYDYNYNVSTLNDLHYFENIGTSTNSVFQQSTLPGIAFQQLGNFPCPEFADLDADGDLDMVTINSDSAQYLENTGTASSPVFARRFAAANPFDNFNQTDVLASKPNFIDFDDDGDLDMFYGNDGGHIRYYENTGTASALSFDFTQSPLIPGGSLDTADFGAFIIVDFDDVTGDGVLDLITGSFNPGQFTWMKGSFSGPTVSIAGTNISCNGQSDGSAIATATGVAPFFYQWSTGDTLTTSGTSTVSGLAAGTYTVTVTETGGATATDMVTITEPVVLTTTTAAIDMDCFGADGGEITATPTGGTGPYSFLWSNGSIAAKLEALQGTYTVTVTDANGCTITATDSILEPAMLVATTVLDSNDSGGGNGGASSNASGGTAPYSYLWSNAATTASITGVVAGTYTVTITDNNGCTDSEPVTIASGPSVSVVIDSNVSCNGFTNGGASANVSGGATPYTYLWSIGATTASITGVAAGTYSVIITDNNGLTATNSGTITEPAALIASSVVDSNVTCNGELNGGATASATGGTAPYTYVWNNTATNASITGIGAGSYSVTITDANGCTTTSSTSITEPTAIIVDINEGDTACFSVGDSVQLSVNPQAGLNYEWSTPSDSAVLLGAAGFSGGRISHSVAFDGNNVPFVAFPDRGNSNGITVMKYDGTNWVTVGGVNITGGSVNGNYDLAIDNSNVPYVVYEDILNSDKATVIKFNGSSWVTVGSAGISAGSSDYLKMAIDGNNVPYVVYADGANSNGATVLKYDGSSWVVVGSVNFSTGGIDTPDIVIDGNNTPLVSYKDDSNGSGVTVKKFDGTNWLTVGNVNLSAGSVSYPSLAVNNNNVPYVVYEQSGPKSMKYDGTSWVPVGNLSSLSNLSARPQIRIDNNNVPNVCFVDFNRNGISLARFDGSNWAFVDQPNLTPGGGSEHYFSIDGNNVPHVVFDDFANGGRSTVIAVKNVLTPFDNSPSVYVKEFGDYVLTATSTATGCNSSDTIHVEVCKNPIVNMQVDSTVSCNGLTNGGATASVTSTNPPYTYAWSNSATTASITGVAAGTYTVTVTNGIALTTVDSVTITEPNILSSAVVVDSNVTCKGLSNGGATASATGGTAPYTYLWNNTATNASITGIGAGSYSVTITDANGCTSTSSASITEPDSIRFNLIQTTDVNCNGGADGSFIYSISGGTPSISGTDTTYIGTSAFGVGPLDVRDTVTGLTAGPFVFIVGDQNGCTSDTITITINEPSALILSAVVDSNVSCNGFTDGGATASATGGIAPYTYAWSNSATSTSITGVAAGSYTVTVTDANGCTQNNSVTITEPAVLAASTVVDSNVTCNGLLDGGITASASGGTAPYSYSWNNTATTASITGIAAGTYSVTITDANGCTSTSSATVTEPTTLVAATVVDSNVTCNTFADGGATASATGGTAPYTYLWNNTATTASITGVVAGTYSVTITDANGCTSTSSSSITEPNALVATAVVDSNTTCLGFTDGGASATAIGGTTPYTYVWSNAATTASITGIAAGNYTVTITDANGCTSTNSATIGMVDTVKPTVITQGVTVYLGTNGITTISTNSIDNGSSDACGIQSMSLDITSFSCADLGNNTVQLRVTDVNGNTDSASATVTVLEILKPTVITQNVTIYLDANGSASITTMDVDNGSSDNCGIQGMSLDTSNFTCADVGANTVQLRVTDVNGNIDSAAATVTVLDTINPTVSTQNVTVYLDANGAATITTTDINNGSTDNCSVQTITLSQTTFNCTEEGTNTVQLIVTDVNNNVDSASAIVTVLDTINPLIGGCPTNIMQTIDAGNCTAVVTWTAPTAADNCTVDSLVASHNPGDVFALGTTTVTYIAYDPELNTDTCTFTVTITDNENPVIANVPANITVSNDSSVCGAVVTWNSVTATDNCTLDSLRSDFQSGEQFPIGTTTVTYTAYDAAGNTSTASFTVTVNDTELPTIVCPADIAQCDSVVTFSGATAADNCSGFTITRADVTGLNSGDIFPKGVSTLSYLVTDASNNQATCDVDIRVYEPAKANAGRDTLTRDIQPIQILASSQNAVQFNWTPFMSLVDETVEQPIANPQETTVYTMIVTSPDGCTDSDDMTITVNIVRDIDATTLFSPNGDGRNDTWTINKPALVQDCRLTIFNRNGTEVYSVTGYINDWDGTVNGEQLPEGTYYYIFDCPDGQDDLNGPITILRERR